MWIFQWSVVLIYPLSIADTNDALIFYTLNGTKPNPFQRLGQSHTYTYKDPFTLPPGKVRNVPTAGVNPFRVTPISSRIHFNCIVKERCLMQPFCDVCLLLVSRDY